MIGITFRNRYPAALIWIAYEPLFTFANHTMRIHGANCIVTTSCWTCTRIFALIINARLGVRTLIVSTASNYAHKVAANFTRSAIIVSSAH